MALNLVWSLLFRQKVRFSHRNSEQKKVKKMIFSLQRKVVSESSKKFSTHPKHIFWVSEILYEVRSQQQWNVKGFKTHQSKYTARNVRNFGKNVKLKVFFEIEVCAKKLFCWWRTGLQSLQIPLKNFLCNQSIYSGYLKSCLRVALDVSEKILNIRRTDCKISKESS